MILDATGQPYAAPVHEPVSPDAVHHAPQTITQTEGYFDRLEEAIETSGRHVFKMPTREQKDFFGDVIAEASSAADGVSNEKLDEYQAAYESSLWIYDAVFAIATNLAQVPVVAYSTGASGKEDEPDSELQALIDNPGEGMMSTDELIERAVTFFQLTGNEFVFAEREHREANDPRGNIVGFRPLRPSRVSIYPGDGPWGIEKYVHTVSGHETSIHPLNMIFMRMFNPNDDYWGQSPLTVLAKAVAIDEYGEEWNKSLVEKGGHPDVVAESKGHVSRRTKRQVRQEYESRFKRSGAGLLILDEGLNIKNAGFSPKDMEFALLMRGAMHRILSAYGVPPIMVMDLRDASILANADTQRELFWEQTIFPLAQRISNTFTRIIRTDPRFASGGWGLRFAFEQVESLRKSDAERERLAKEHYSGGGITLNEYRTRIGEEPISEEEGGDQFFTPPTPAGPGIASLSAKPETMSGGAPSSIVVSGEQKRLGRRAYANLVRLHEGDFVPEMKKFFKDQSVRVVRAFRDHLNLDQGRKAHVPDGDFIDESMLASIFDLDAELKALLDRMGPVYISALLDSANTKLADIIADRTTFELIAEDADRVRSALNEWGATRVKGITTETQRSLRDILSIGFEDGATPNELEKRIKGLFKLYQDGPKKGTGSRAETIARTEMAAALNAGSFTAAREAEENGIRLLKSWLSARDSRVRDSHKRLDAETSANPIELGRPFSNGLMFPNEMSGSGSETINCRCSMLEIVAE